MSPSGDKKKWPTLIPVALIPDPSICSSREVTLDLDSTGFILHTVPSCLLNNCNPGILRSIKGHDRDKPTSASELGLVNSVLSKWTDRPIVKLMLFLL